MKEKVYITEVGLAGSFNEFNEAILVKVIPIDFLDYYHNNQEDKDYNETLKQTEQWLMFNRYDGKDQWVMGKKQKCDCGMYWEIDYDNFICRSMCITNRQTGEGFIRPIYQVIMTNYNIDAVEASELGTKRIGRNGVQKALDELNLQLIGESGSMYYLLTNIRADNSAFAIPYDLVHESGGCMYFDKITVQKSHFGKNGYIVLSIKPDYGIFNPLTKEVFTFA